MIKVISAHKEDSSSASPQITEEDVKNFLINNNRRLLIHIGTVDEREPNVFPTGYYFDRDLDKIYIATQKKSKKVSNLRVKSIVSYCIDDPNPPHKGVRGKGKVKIHEEDINYNIAIVKKLLMSRIGSLEDPMSKWLLSEVERGNEVILEITPSYYSMWDFSRMG